jgi:hypothetical protein
VTAVAPKHVRWWAVIFLPILLRALIPVGFMPIFGPGFSVQLVICDGYAPLPWTNAPSMAMDMPADMPMDGGVGGAAGSHRGHPSHEDHGTCPFGASPVLGALPSLAKVPLWLERARELAVAAAQVTYFQVSFRAQSPRGPPA